MGCRWTLASKYDKILFNFPREKNSEPFEPFNDCDNSLLYKESNKQKMELFGHNTSIRLYGFYYDLAKLNDLSSKWIFLHNHINHCQQIFKFALKNSYIEVPNKQVLA